MEPEVEEDGRVKKKTDGNGTGPRSGYGAPGGRKRAQGPGWIGMDRDTPMGVTCKTPLQFVKNYIHGFHGFKFLPRRYTGDPPLAA